MRSPCSLAFLYFEKLKERLCDHHAVCVFVHLLFTFSMRSKGKFFNVLPAHSEPRPLIQFRNHFLTTSVD
jgi:hypothetical protein